MTLKSEKIVLKETIYRRFQYIECVAYYCGAISRRELARAFGLSDPAATKILRRYNELMPNNLVYRQVLFAFVPTEKFQPEYADLSPQVVLSSTAWGESGKGFISQSSLGGKVENLPLLYGFPTRENLSQITRAIYGRKKMVACYCPLKPPDEGEEAPSAERVLEPHALFNANYRWYVRAYNLSTYDFRNFALSRFVSVAYEDKPADSEAVYDEDWSELIKLCLAPHPDLSAYQKQAILLDHGAIDGVIRISLRRAFTGYVLRQLSVDTTLNHRCSPKHYPLILLNRDELVPYAGWAFMKNPV